MVVNKYVGNNNSYNVFQNRIAKKEISIDSEKHKMIVEKGSLAERVVSRRLSGKKLGFVDFIKNLVATIFSNEYCEAKSIISDRLWRYYRRYDSQVNPYVALYKHYLGERLQAIFSKPNAFSSEEMRALKKEVYSDVKHLPLNLAKELAAELNQQSKCSKSKTTVIKTTEERASDNQLYYVTLNQLDKEEEQEAKIEKNETDNGDEIENSEKNSAIDYSILHQKKETVENEEIEEKLVEQKEELQPEEAKIEENEELEEEVKNEDTSGNSILYYTTLKGAPINQDKEIESDEIEENESQEEIKIEEEKKESKPQETSKEEKPEIQVKFVNNAKKLFEDFKEKVEIVKEKVQTVKGKVGTVAENLVDTVKEKIESINK